MVASALMTPDNINLAEKRIQSLEWAKSLLNTAAPLAPPAQSASERLRSIQDLELSSVLVTLEASPPF
eukprot:9141253-Karenia_brevis.AAC.1